MRCRPAGLALLFILSTLFAPLVGEAQQAGKVYRVALIFTTSPVSEMAGPDPVHPAARGLVHGLRALGYVEGQNLILERRSAEGRFERFGDIVREVVALKCDVIVTTDRIAREARRVTSRVPIVVGISSNPVESGLVASLARPGGNVTGMSGDAGPELFAKELELLREALPKTSRAAFLGSKFEWDTLVGQSLRGAAPTLGMTVLLAESAPGDYTQAFAAIAQKRAGAVIVGTDGDIFANRQQIVDLTNRRRLPLIGWSREFTEAGGLMSYGPSVGDLFRRAAGYVDKILRGAKPADLPIEQPTKFELVINLKTAKALGLTIPQSLLGRADQVLE